eukprot:TRINITY_DN91438_c0_g1_i1.p1 TRINITY_DN91438_c0_g1~~TRINITY_DN91438_c0_g1_i1.p1  ORF type:complete len:1134 (+),score=221.71 TRINITY_DN91438_c0_g1_i1:115-3402(+)
MEALLSMDSVPLLSFTSILGVIVAAAIIAAYWRRAASLASRSKGSEDSEDGSIITDMKPDPVKMKAIEDWEQPGEKAEVKPAAGKYLEVCLERASGEAWGFAWHVRAYATQRFLVAGIDPNSPAGRWGQERQQQGLPAIGRGDELISANETSNHGIMRRELVVADKLCLQFLRADAVPPVETIGQPGNTAAQDAALRRRLAGARAAQQKMLASGMDYPVQDSNEHDEEGWGPDDPQPQIVTKPNDALQERLQMCLEEKIQPLKPRKTKGMELNALPKNFWSYQREPLRSLSRTGGQAVSNSALVRKSFHAGVRSRSDPPPSAAQSFRTRWERSGSTSPFKSGCLSGIDLPLSCQEQGGSNLLDNSSGSSVPGEWDSAQSFMKQFASRQVSQVSHNNDIVAENDKDSNIFSGGSGCGSGSENTSEKCPSTDWEYMMDNRPGYSMQTPGESRSAPVQSSAGQQIGDGHSHASNPGSVVIVAGSQALALQTASALGTVLAGGLLPTAASDEGGRLRVAPTPAPLLPPQQAGNDGVGQGIIPPPPLTAPRLLPALPDHRCASVSSSSHLGHPLQGRGPVPVVARTPAESVQSRMFGACADPRYAPACAYPAHGSHTMQQVPPAPMGWPLRQDPQFVAPVWNQQPKWYPQHVQDAGSHVSASTSHGWHPSASSMLPEAAMAAAGPSALSAALAQAAPQVPAQKSPVPSLAARPGKQSVVPSAAVRADSAPPALRPQAGAVAPVSSDARPRKKTYRAGQRVTAKRIRAAQRAAAREERVEGDAADGAQADGRSADAEALARRTAPTQSSSTGSSSRSDSAPPALRRDAQDMDADHLAKCTGSSAQASNAAGRLYYKPRRRAGVKVRQRMEYAIARRREQGSKPDAEGEQVTHLASEDVAMAPPSSLAPSVPSRSSEKMPSDEMSHSLPSDGASRPRPSKGGASSRSFYPSKAPALALHGSEQTASSSSVRVPVTEDSTAPSRKRSKHLSEAKNDSVAKRVQAQKQAATGTRLAEDSSDDIIGQKALINGLVHAPHFNGQWGLVDSYDAELKRYVVRVFVGEQGAQPVLAKLRRDSLVVPKASPPGPEELQRGPAWQPSLRM